jgi:hypothetical protein
MVTQTMSEGSFRGAPLRCASAYGSAEKILIRFFLARPAPRPDNDYFNCSTTFLSPAI